MNATVAHSRTLLDDLLSAEMRPGGTEAALRSIARREKIPYASLWALRYRPPKDVYASTLLALDAAHRRMCDRQLERYRAARDATDTTTWLGSHLTRLAAAIAGEGAVPQAPD